MKTPAEIPLKRSEKFTRLADLCPAIINALHSHVKSPEDIFVAFRTGVSLECAECHTIVPGEELYLLGQPAEGEETNPDRRRLRLGFCPNLNCKSFDCMITFKPDPVSDWASQLRRADRCLRDLEDSRAGRSKHWRTALIRPALIAAFGLLLIFLAHQLYFGGRIPWLREPEKFQTDPDPGAEPRP